MNCYQAKAGELAKHWFVIDAEGMVVGRLAAQIAPILMGKHRPTYTPHIDTGDFVIVTNVDKVVFTGEKWRQKSYQRYSGYPGRPEGRGGLEAVPAPAGADPRAGHPADDAEEQDRPAHAGQAEAVRRAGPSASGAAADPARAALGASHAEPVRSMCPSRRRKRRRMGPPPGRLPRPPRWPRPPPRPRSRLRPPSRPWRLRAPEPALEAPAATQAECSRSREPGRARFLVNRGECAAIAAHPRGASSDPANPPNFDPRRGRGPGRLGTGETQGRS